MVQTCQESHDNQHRLNEQGVNSSTMNLAKSFFVSQYCNIPFWKSGWWYGLFTGIPNKYVKTQNDRPQLVVATDVVGLPPTTNPPAKLTYLLKKCWLEDCFPFKMAPFSSDMLIFGRVFAKKKRHYLWNPWKIWGFFVQKFFTGFTDGNFAWTQQRFSYER